ncbi:MAG: ribonuclease III [Defluviitaleaceae bacterium]|nr:ribonuclease III [Defluviitaleaceae bacterium]
MNEKELIKIEQKIGYSFRDKALLTRALTHSSFVHQRKKSPFESNQRLEFLGDAVLEIIVSEFLFHCYPEMSEGELTKLRAKIVCEPNLSSTAGKLSLAEYALLGEGEERMKGREKAALRADLVEAVIGAIYLDSGINSAKKFVVRNVEMDNSNLQSNTDYKTLLQEYVQRDSRQTVTYKKESEKGPDHDKVFTTSVWHKELKLATGVGASLKKAEQDSAKKALEKLGVMLEV